MNAFYGWETYEYNPHDAHLLCLALPFWIACAKVKTQEKHSRSSPVHHYLSSSTMRKDSMEVVRANVKTLKSDVQSATTVASFGIFLQRIIKPQSIIVFAIKFVSIWILQALAQWLGYISPTVLLQPHMNLRVWYFNDLCSDDNPCDDVLIATHMHHDFELLKTRHY